MSEQDDIVLINRLTHQNVALMKQRDEALASLEVLRTALNDNAEHTRRRNHHEVLCLVLKELIRSDPMRPILPYISIARDSADLAYPPPSAAQPGVWSPMQTTVTKVDVENGVVTMAKAPPWPSLPDEGT